mmetsp:Transcript_111866/g.316034  ORF Transcript_111866/g.316034 Transcript_111866/m.316034 type:complete len:282 (-) Transcript_111866:215-1060(-)
MLGRSAEDFLSTPVKRSLAHAAWDEPSFSMRNSLAAKPDVAPSTAGTRCSCAVASTAPPHFAPRPYNTEMLWSRDRIKLLLCDDVHIGAAGTRSEASIWVGPAKQPTPARFRSVGAGEIAFDAQPLADKAAFLSSPHAELRRPSSEGARECCSTESRTTRLKGIVMAPGLSCSAQSCGDVSGSRSSASRKGCEYFSASAGSRAARPVKPLRLAGSAITCPMFSRTRFTANFHVIFFVLDNNSCSSQLTLRRRVGTDSPRPSVMPSLTLRISSFRPFSLSWS